MTLYSTWIAKIAFLFLINDFFNFEFNKNAFCLEMKSKLMTLNKDTMNTFNRNKNSMSNSDDGPTENTGNKNENNTAPYIQPKITYDNNPNIDHVIIENQRFYPNRQGEVIPNHYSPEKMTYQETEDYVVSLIKKTFN